MAMPHPILTPQKDPTSPQPSSYNPASTITSPSSSTPPYQRPKRLLVFQETKSSALEYAYAPVNAQGLPIAGEAPYFPGCSTTISDLPVKVIRCFTEVFNSPRYKNWAIVAAGPYHDASEDGKFYAVVLEQVRDQPSNGGDAVGR
ncbi:hypothetical protein BGW36DRAFT_430908 [Talaromyces proteolyticus]|uniref:Uncharacterized protein n=1 Tax=Talaromyces proteolyticus TaxID=1131652 RepID=A0AAD4KK10_9EURO|nr:uncharacterized protein BGW36DRAFT_430908 [Talaromyces proteolyticus]KAH8693170.1 hypothetical protein BGW36DRAFT_430908 [Talaromyces proteolyticus]